MPSTAQGRSAALVASSRGSEQGEGVLVASLPRTISEAGERAAFHFIEFFTARIPNSNTRAAYGHAVAEFCQWCQLRAIPLPSLSSGRRARKRRTGDGARNRSRTEDNGESQSTPAALPT
jgi:hypothetical protein